MAPSSIDEAAVRSLLDRARRDVDSGVVPSCQLAVALDDEIVVEATFGEAEPDSRYAIFSCTKALVAAAVWLLIGEGSLDVHRPVTDHLPEFAANGKERITVEQLLIHTAGFPQAPLDPRAVSTRAQRVERFASWRLNWEPGSRFEYHPTSAHWVLGEIVERLSGVDLPTFVRTRILEPLGLHRLRLGDVPERTGDVNHLVSVGHPPTSEELEAVTGIAGLDYAELVGEVTHDVLLAFNDPQVLALGMPGAGAISTAADLARFYQALLHDTGSLWDPDVLADGTGRVRCILPHPLHGVAANRSLGLVVAGDPEDLTLRGFGNGCSTAAFGHNGAGGQIAWADPASGLSFTYLTNGLDANVIREARRGISLSSHAAAVVRN